MTTKAKLELRCPDCGDREPTLFRRNIVCEECGGVWESKDTWKCYSVVRQCVSKIDYEFYLHLEKSKSSV